MKLICFAPTLTAVRASRMCVCVCVCVCVFVPARVHACILRACVRDSVCVCVCGVAASVPIRLRKARNMTHSCALITLHSSHTTPFIYVYICIYLWEDVCMYVCTCCMFIHSYVCVCVYIYVNSQFLATFYSISFIDFTLLTLLTLLRLLMLLTLSTYITYNI